MEALLAILGIVIVLFAVITLVKSVRIVPQQDGADALVGGRHLREPGSGVVDDCQHAASTTTPSHAPVLIAATVIPGHVAPTPNPTPNTEPP